MDSPEGWEGLSDGELRQLLLARVTGVASPEEVIDRLVMKREDERWSAVIEDILTR